MRIAVAIPCYRVKRHILSVLEAIGQEVHKIYVVDDCCPQSTGRFVLNNNRDPRVEVIFLKKNQGVGNAICKVYERALVEGFDIIIKIDGDGQMDPSLIPRFTAPIINGKADYTKGNRFYALRSLSPMPKNRLVGNFIFSLVNKAASGYWNIMDTTNGYTAIHRQGLSMLPLSQLNRGFFFESDMLFHLGRIRAVVRDIPMDAKYTEEVSNLKIKKAVMVFPYLYLKNLIRRINYKYSYGCFNTGSAFLASGLVFFLSSLIVGFLHCIPISAIETPVKVWPAILCALSVIFLSMFCVYDIKGTPAVSIVGRERDAKSSGPES